MSGILQVLLAVSSATSSKQYILAPGVYITETGTRSEILAPGVYLRERAQ